MWLNGAVALLLVSGASALSGFGVKKPSGSPVSSFPPDDSSCKCGSELDYSICCKPFHMKTAIASTPIELTRTRYSAYAIGLMEYIVASTSSTSSDYIHYEATTPSKEKAVKRWIKDLKFNFKDYRFVRMEVVSSQSADPLLPGSSTSTGSLTVPLETAEVTFRQLAIRKGDNVMYPTEETSSLVRGEGGEWLYVSGVVTRPPSEVSVV